MKLARLNPAFKSVTHCRFLIADDFLLVKVILKTGSFQLHWLDYNNGNVLDKSVNWKRGKAP